MNYAVRNRLEKYRAFKKPRVWPRISSRKMCDACKFNLVYRKQRRLPKLTEQMNLCAFPWLKDDLPRGFHIRVRSFGTILAILIPV